MYVTVCAYIHIDVVFICLDKHFQGRIGMADDFIPSMDDCWYGQVALLLGDSDSMFELMEMS